MAFIGNDPGQLRTLAAQLNGNADQIQNILTQLTSQLNNTQWQGADASRFRSEWTGTHTAQLRAVINALHEASRTATQNASQQETASA